MTETEVSGAKGVGAVLAMLGLVAAITVGALALGSNTPAAAEGLEQFESCAELEAWSNEMVAPTVSLGDDLVLQEGQRDVPGAATGGSAGAPVPSTSAAEPSAALPSADATSEESSGNDSSSGASSSDSSGALASDGDTGGTNTVVEGVDEIDVIDRVSDDRLLVSRQGALALVDLTGLTVVAELGGLPYDARISLAGDLVWVAGSSLDGVGSVVRRIRLDGDSLTDDGTWSTPGYLLDARRTGDRLHVVAVDYPQADVVPFEGGDVPCDQVWRPIDPTTTPAATLVATLPAEGELTPTAAAEVTGAAGNLLVTDDSVFLATETYATDGTVSTGVHRFDGATLVPTGSGSVPGILAGPFALSEHEGNLRVATSLSSGFFFGGGIPIEGDVIIDDAPVAEADAEPVAEPEAAGALVEVLVLDTEGDLDIVGRTGLFGRDGETIHGVRFVGDVAYVVTFLQTDPFWVIDLADPSAPAVVGELQVPGFSGYLHPLGEGRVVGFGPDGAGGVSARLFDVSDPSAPSLLDEIALGDDTPVAYDHHAYVDLGDGRFAVPVSDYPTYDETECVEVPIGEPVPVEPRPIEPGIGDGSTGTSGSSPGSTGSAGVDVGADPAVPTTEPATTEPATTVVTTTEVPATEEPIVDQPIIEEPPVFCQPVPIGGATGAAVLELADGRLSLVERAVVESAELWAERVILAPDGTWLLLSYDRIVATDDGAELLLPIG